jgi:hypothetical protein
MDIKSIINNIKNKPENRGKFVYQVPIKEITNRIPILQELWADYKGMCSYGTQSGKQTSGLNKVIESVPYLKDMREEVMNYPDKEKYDRFEQTEIFGKPENLPVVIPFNNVWHIKNGKYQHSLNGLCFPRYHWDNQKLRMLENINIEPRGNFYYPPGGFREWHSNRTHGAGYRMYFVACDNDNQSGLNYVDPVTDKVNTHYDKNEHANIFYVTDSKSEAFFHAVFSDTNRFSLGFNIY